MNSSTTTSTGTTSKRSFRTRTSTRTALAAFIQQVIALSLLITQSAAFESRGSSTTRYASTSITHQNHSSRKQTSSLWQTKYNHALSILTVPRTSIERIANEAILESILPHTKKLSIVLRCTDTSPSVASLRRYVGEIYSQLWDCAMGSQSPELPDAVVYPQNLPNAAPESWINIQSDLDCICSHDSIIGWVSKDATGRGIKYQDDEGAGIGGMEEHVEAVNSERKQRGLAPVAQHRIERWPEAATILTGANDNVVFLDDDEEERDRTDEPENDSLIGGTKVPSKQMFESVAVGGTFDGLHFGHRKLLTLAVSSCTPLTGSLMVGVTADEMLKSKENSDLIPKIDERIQGVKNFLGRLAPGMMNRIRVLPITDSFGPPGQPGNHFDALVLSHETLDTGRLLNLHREKLDLPPLHLLCTRRTEVHGMSSTTLRRLRRQQQQEQTL